MEFPTQEYWSGLPFHSLGDLCDPGIKRVSYAVAGYSLPLSLVGSPKSSIVSEFLRHETRTLILALFFKRPISPLFSD